MFNTAVIDFPTPYRTWSNPDGDSLPYDVMTEEQMTNSVKALLPLMCKTPAVFVWSTMLNIFLTERAMSAAGMTFSTFPFYWIKTNPNSKKKWDEAIAKVRHPDMFAATMGANFTLPYLDHQSWYAYGRGHWTRQNPEVIMLFLLRQGKKMLVPKRLRMDIFSVIFAPVHKKHSKKPEEFQDKIEQLVSGPYIELFARRHRPGWTCIGNDLSGNDILVDLEQLRESNPHSDSLLRGEVQYDK